MKKKKIIIFYCILILSIITFLLIVRLTISQIRSFNQAESINSLLFDIGIEIQKFYKQKHYLPSNLKIINIDHEILERINNMEHGFINKKNYIFYVIVNDQYSCVLTNQRNNYQPIIIETEKLKKILKVEK